VGLGVGVGVSVGVAVSVKVAVGVRVADDVNPAIGGSEQASRAARPKRAGKR
jgi:hypothetical protein